MQALPTRPSPAAAAADAVRPRILLVAPQPFYEDRGTPIALLHLLRSYVAAGCAVDVLTFPLGSSPDLPHVRYLRVANPLRWRRIAIGFSFRKLCLDVLLAVELRRVLRRNRYAMVHAVEESAFVAVLLARRHDVPVLYDMQSNLAHQLSSHRVLGQAPLGVLWRACQRWLIQRSAAVGCSMGLADDVRAAAAHKPVFEWRYPGQVRSVTDDASTAAELRRSLNLRPGQRIVLYAGNFEAYQVIDLLIEAMASVSARCDDVVLVLIGAQPDELPTIRARVLNAMSADRFRLLPRVDRDRMSHYLRLADVLVSPRVFGDNLPLKIVDYLAAGRPIVATRIKAHCRVLEDDMAVLVEPMPAALAEGITALLRDADLRQTLAARGCSYFNQHLSQRRFDQLIADLLTAFDERTLVAEAHTAAPGSTSMAWGPPRAAEPAAPSVSVIIPVRNGAALLGQLIDAIRGQQAAERITEIIVVDDDSTDDTAAVARAAGARVVRPVERSGNPAHARNVGARIARGDLLIFLDADCVPRPGWLAVMLQTRARGWRCIGGALAMPPRLNAMSRLDYYSSWYHVHERQTARPVAHHPPCNLAIDRRLFLSTSGFVEQHPIAYAHEELQWQDQLRERGVAILMQPAVAEHHHRDGLSNVLRRNYRWAYSAIPSKHATHVARARWMYRYPLLGALLGMVLTPLQAGYIMTCWLRVGRWEALVMSPLLLLARMAYTAGLVIGTLRWRLDRMPDIERRPLWE